MNTELETPFTDSGDLVIEIEAWRDQLKDMRDAIRYWNKESPITRTARMRIDCLLSDLGSLANEIYRSGDYQSWESREEKIEAAKAALASLKEAYKPTPTHLRERPLQPAQRGALGH